jgi:hypothetical protein
MIATINMTLILLICCGATLIKRSNIAILYALFGVAMLIVMAVSENIEPYGYYYLIDAIALICVAEIVPHVKPITKASITIQRLCFVGILANFVGWLLWIGYFPPVLYNLIWLGVYLAVLWTMLDRGAHEPRRDGLFSTVDCVRNGYYSVRNFDVGNR